MRSMFATALAATALLVSATKLVDTSPAIDTSECIYTAISESNLACDVNVIVECVQAGTKNDVLDRLQQCLQDSGCLSEEAQQEAHMWAEACAVGRSEESGKELRRRDDSSPTETITDASTTTAAATTTSDSTTSESTSTTASTSSASAAASTTVASSTASSFSSSATTSGSTTLSTSTTSSTASSTSSSSSNSCLTYSFSTTSTCAVTSGATTCATSTATASACADGMYCTTDSAGGALCMALDNKLTASGTAVAVIFGTMIATFIITMISCAYRDSQQADRRRKAMEAALEADAKTAAVAMDVKSVKRRASRAIASPPSGMNRLKSPLAAAPLLSGQGENDGGDYGMQSSQHGQRSLTGLGSSSPSQGEEGLYHDAARV